MVATVVWVDFSTNSETNKSNLPRYKFFSHLCASRDLPKRLVCSRAQEGYFLPLYPCFAALIALVIERCSTAEPGSLPRRNWDHYLVMTGLVTGVLGAIAVVASVLPFSFLETIHQPRWFAFTLGIFCFSTGWICIRASASESRELQAASILSIGLVGAVTAGALINDNVVKWNDPDIENLEMKTHVPAPEKVVSLGPIDHRFAYYYQTPIKQLPWPTLKRRCQMMLSILFLRDDRGRTPRKRPRVAEEVGSRPLEPFPSNGKNWPQLIATESFATRPDA